MMSSEKGKFPYPFFIPLTQCHEFPAPKLTNLYHLSTSERDIIFKESLFGCTY